MAGEAKTGRPSKLNPEVEEKIITAVKAGNYIETAAAFAGIAKSTLYDWLRRGANAPRQSPYRRFADALGEALAHAEVKGVTIIAAASRTQWQAAAWLLERRNPDRWGRKAALKVHATEEEMGSAEVDLSKYSAEELEELETLLAKQESDPTLTEVPRDDTETIH